MNNLSIFFVIVSISATLADESVSLASQLKITRTVLRACENAKLVIQCPANTEIVINKGWYGRLDASVCPSNQLFTLSCYRDATVLIAGRCNDRDTCVVPSNNDLVGDPCGKTHKYLEVDYSCKNTQFPLTKITACEDTTSSIQCPPNNEIIVKSAFYGRLKGPELCPKEGLMRDFQCYADASAKVATACNRRPYCSVAVNNRQFGEPCAYTRKYLEVNYYCSAVQIVGK